jgi:hypothetical protein
MEIRTVVEDMERRYAWFQPNGKEWHALNLREDAMPTMCRMVQHHVGVPVVFHLPADAERCPTCSMWVTRSIVEEA